MYSRPAASALRDRLVTVTTTRLPIADAETDAELRERVCAAVDDFKAAGWPPERVVIAMKQIARDAGLTPSRNLTTLSRVLITGRDAVIAKVVRRSIDRYYQASTS
jgi:hypothetical protein